MDAYTQGRQEAEQTITEYGIGLGTFLIEQTVSSMNHNRMTEDEREYKRGLWHRMQELTEGKTAKDYMKPEQK
jgi:hypothetical protein